MLQPCAFSVPPSRAGRIGLAPMEGVIDATTRHLLTAIGGFDWVVTEFVRVIDARLPAKVFLRICPELAQGASTPTGVPVHLQLLGSIPEVLGANALQAVACGATCIDMNFGCPAKLVNRHDGGASLLRDPRRVFAAVRGVSRALEGTGVPVTAKIRLGFDDKRLAIACARAAEEGGATQLAVHARTRREGYRPPAHWEWIGRLRTHVSIPVVANGDIWTLEDYWKARTLSGCHDVMLGRGALADPWLAARIRHWQQSGEQLAATTWAERAMALHAYATQIGVTLPDKVVLSLLKQWLNIMRQPNDEAADHFLAMRRIQSLSAFLQALLSTSQAQQIATNPVLSAS